MTPAAAHIDAHTSAAIFWNIYLGAKDRGQPDNQLQRHTHVLKRPEISGRGAIGTFYHIRSEGSERRPTSREVEVLLLQLAKT